MPETELVKVSLRWPQQKLLSFRCCSMKRVLSCVDNDTGRRVQRSGSCRAPDRSPTGTDPELLPPWRGHATVEYCVLQGTALPDLTAVLPVIPRSHRICNTARGSPPLPPPAACVDGPHCIACISTSSASVQRHWRQPERLSGLFRVQASIAAAPLPAPTEKHVHIAPAGPTAEATGSGRQVVRKRKAPAMQQKQPMATRPTVDPQTGQADHDGSDPAPGCIVSCGLTAAQPDGAATLSIESLPAPPFK